MIDIDHLRLLKAVAHAAHAYREAMRHYIREQTGLLDNALVVLEWYASTAHRE